MREPYWTDLENCARCGETHMNIEFRPFTNPPKPDPATHFTLCPTTQEPILSHLIHSRWQGIKAILRGKRIANKVKRLP